MTNTPENDPIETRSSANSGIARWPRPMGLDLSLEDLALLTIARKDLDDGSLGLLDALTHQQLDWNHLIEASAWHKLQGLMYRHFSRPELAGHAPAQAMEILETRYKHNVARQLFFDQELAKILSLFDEQGIEAIIMKGAALVPEIYGGDPGVRPMSDVDIIVRPERASDAERLLREIGYRPGVAEEEQTHMREVDRQLAAMARPGSPVIVEIHTHLVGTDSPIRFDIDRIWDHVVPSQTLGVTHFVLDPTALLAAQSVNFMKDRRFYSYSALGQLCDVAEVIRKYRDVINWEAFGKDGDLSALRGVVFGSVFMANKLLSASVSDEMTEPIRPPQFNENMAAALARERVFGRDWIAKDLDSSGGLWRVWKIPLSMATRIFLSRNQLENRSRGEPITRRQLIAANLKRLGMSLKLAARFSTHPRSLYADLSVDRWLKTLYEPD